MLEHPSLLISPWQERPGRAPIAALESRLPLGFVYRRRRAGWLARLCWWRQHVLAVHECDDEPLLMTVERGLVPWQSWLVRDADGRRVGRVTSRGLFDAIDRPLAVPRTSDGVVVYRGDERDLAETRADEEGVCLTFLLEERASPFLKMVLLAGALIHNQARLLTTASARRAVPPAPRFQP
jgi:hypothetical protein